MAWSPPVDHHEVVVHRPAVRTVTVVTVVLVGLLVLVGASLVGVASLVFGRQEARADEATMLAALRTAAVAQETYRAEHGRYTDARAALTTAGWAPEEDLDLRLLDASATTFCLAAGPLAGDPVMWFTPSGVSDQPCD